MQQRRHRTVVLNCPFFVWRHRRCREIRIGAQHPPVAKPVVLPFTFNDAPPALADGERRVVLKHLQGVKS